MVTIAKHFLPTRLMRFHSLLLNLWNDHSPDNTA